jgi:hypothetical protein
MADGRGYLAAWQPVAYDAEAVRKNSLAWIRAVFVACHLADHSRRALADDWGIGANGQGALGFRCDGDRFTTLWPFALL